MKFSFTTEFQYDILKYTVQDKNGPKILQLYDDTYFTLLGHSVLSYTIKKYYKRKKSIPGKILLKELLINVFNERQFVNNLTEEDRKEILILGENLYKGIVQDGDDLLEKTEKFTQYVDLKHEIENIDLLDHHQYEIFVKKVQKAISPRLKKIDERGSFLIKDARYRQARRYDNPSIVPTPFWQINRLTNAGGYSKGSLLVILDKSKKFKTGMLINVAIGYLKGKKVLVIDLDNGEDEFMIRVEQALTKKTKKEVLSGQYNKNILSHLRKRRRLGSELVVKRMPALITTAADIGGYMDYLYQEFNFRPDVLVVDYISKMGCISGKDSLHERISEAYIDMGNLALEKGIEHVWTAQHVTRNAAKVREKSKYESTDIAGAIDISRHAQAIFGLNRTEIEEANGLQRMEIVDQRDGYSRGYAIFRIDPATQLVAELTEKQRDEYSIQYSKYIKEKEDGEYKNKDLEDAE